MSRRHATAAAAALLLAAPGFALAVGGSATTASFRVVTARPLLVVRQGGAATLRMRVVRSAGFRQQLTLDAWRLPRGARALWLGADGRPLALKRHGRRAAVLPARARAVLLRIRTQPGVHVGSFRFRVSVMSGERRSRQWLRLTVRARGSDTAPAPFAITPRLTSQLRPGISVPVELTITNPRDVPAAVSALELSIDDRTSNPGCRGSTNYVVRRAARAQPLPVPPGTTTLRVPAYALPRVEMLDLPVNQDACKGAVIKLHVTARATS